MTDFDKVKKYYKNFDEKNRLQNDNSGRLEYDMTMHILEKYLPENATILDLGGGAGVYSFPLANKGYKLFLADLSNDLIEQAKLQKQEEDNTNIVSCDVVNAINLSVYDNNQFDVVILFGPLYHLLDKSERQQCISEINRVLKPKGKVFASFIPYLSGSIAIIDRYFRHPQQVDINNLTEVFNSGRFNNLSDSGFQEGYYPSVKEIEELFASNNFNKIVIKSIRGFGYGKEDLLYNIENIEIKNKVIELIDKTSENQSIIDTCGHAIYIGYKN